MNTFETEMKVFGTEVFPQNVIAYLNSGNTSYYFVSSRKVFMVKGNKYTHTLAL